MKTDTPIKTFNSLDEIREQREKLRDEIRKDDKEIQQLWGSLFQKPQMLTSASPSKRIASIFQTSAGLLDAALLGWKLYRKFHKK